MSRSGYSDDLGSEWALIRWRGQVTSATRGKRGQAMLKDLLVALDAIPEKRLIREELVTPDGEVCALGALGMMRNLEMEKIDPEDPEQVALTFGVAAPLAREIMYENDEYRNETAEQRWIRMRKWVESQIKVEAR